MDAWKNTAKAWLVNFLLAGFVFWGVYFIGSQGTMFGLTGSEGKSTWWTNVHAVWGFLSLYALINLTQAYTSQKWRIGKHKEES